ncbi:MAG: M23 family metallopeptidase, partial [Endomicrobia bacterium]|nr:M23 family metallopeptidase [Endomicrobiia bacterium]
FIVFLWTLFTAVSVYFSTRHIDYWSAKIKTMMLGTKYEYLNKELSRTWEMLAQVEHNDRLLRKLLNMKTKKDIIINTPQELNQGGPFLQQSKFLQAISKSPQEVSIVDYKKHFDLLKQQIEQQIQSCDEIFNYIRLQKELYQYTPTIWPSKGSVVSPFGRRIHPVYKIEHFHTGIDIANNIGTPVYATADGKIKFAGWQEGYGKVVVIEHKFGYVTIYGHLSVIKVKQGQKISRGDTIGLMGDTGTTTGPHLHYEIWKDNKLCNPVKFLNPESFFQS